MDNAKLEESLGPLPEISSSIKQSSNVEETILGSWITETDFLPNKIHPLVIKRFLKSVKGNEQEAKKLIKLNYKFRAQEPQLFLQRDPLDMDTDTTFKFIDMVFLPGLTPDNCKIILQRFKKVDLKMANPIRDTKTFLMLNDSRFSRSDNDLAIDFIADSDIQILDMKGCNLRYLQKTKFQLFQVYSKYLQQAFPMPLKAIHIINAPDYFENIYTLIKPFLSRTVVERIRFHGKNIESLYEFIPREMLPLEYGGKAGSIDSLQLQTLQLLQNTRNYLVDPEYWSIAKKN